MGPRRRLLVLALLAPAGACTAPTVDLTPQVGWLALEGDVGVSASSVVALNSVSDLGLDERETAPGGRVDLDWGAVHVTASGLVSDTRGDGVLSADLTSGGTTISAGDSVTSDLDLAVGSAVVTFDLIPGDLELGLGLGVTAVALDLETTSTTTMERITSDEVLPAPLLALRLGGSLGRVELEGLASGIAAEVDDAELALIDADLLARLRLFGDREHLNGSLTLGYRHLSIDAEYDDGSDRVDADVRLSGPYLGFTLSF